MDPNLVSYDGSITLLNELGVDPASVDVLPLSFYLESPALGQFTRSEFLNGWLRLGVGASSIYDQEELKRQQRESMVQIMNAFRANATVLPKFNATEKASSLKGLYTAVYEYTFAFARPEGQKNLRMYLKPSFSPAQWDLWKRFLTTASNLRVISKDTWTQFLAFMREIDPRFETHDYEAAWPSVIDEFVAWVHEQQ
ncbi:Scaffold-type E3 ligase [Malassezia caprae]|uniref:Defective in cullin neddylation protein n=1 Tax=Malassezia caprae TaxID=1381934 RepID=A0AAF0E868_9BASI|nr:Scaffold-type E3 ligase [Malassezia caprae]